MCQESDDQAVFGRSVELLQSRGSMIVSSLRFVVVVVWVRLLLFPSEVQMYERVDGTQSPRNADGKNASIPSLHG